MLKSVILGFTESGSLELETKGITIFVGPNNSGKSLVLRELEEAFRVHPFPQGLKILKDYDVEWPSLEEVKARIAKAKLQSEPGLPLGHFSVSRISPSGGRETSTLTEPELEHIVSLRTDRHWLATQYLKWGVLRLDGRSRFDLTNDQVGGDLQSPPQNVLAHLFQDDEARLKVRATVKDAFDLTFMIDPTNLGQLRIRLATSNPLFNEQSLNHQAREFHGNALHIKDASDGVQAFTGIIAAVMSGEFHTLMIDEPEAFLHPPLARKLGKYLASLATERGGSLIASTHSADFLMGCVQTSQSVRVVRLEYSQGKSRARSIDPKQLNEFFRKPLIRSANVISGLFHDGVIVLESDNDRAFYAEIYYRMSEGRPGCPSILFVNAQNKQTISEIMGPLRQFGVPAAAITDIDVVKDKGTSWLTAARVPSALHIGWNQQRSAIDAALKASGRDMKNDGGISILEGQERAAAEQYLSQLETFGVFVVERGELENWLPELQVPGKKTDWAIKMLERLGSDPMDTNYVRPGEDDVWFFMEKIVSWIKDPARKGTV